MKSFLLVALFAVVVVSTTGCGVNIRYNKNEQSKPIVHSTSTEPIFVELPQPNTKIASPITITGKAVGKWYFEGSFSVSLIDSSQNVIARGIAVATEPWMTTEYVPFTVKLDFTSSKSMFGEKGFLLFEKDNPSGLPENAAQFRVPVTY